MLAPQQTIMRASANFRCEGAVAKVFKIQKNICNIFRQIV